MPRLEELLSREESESLAKSFERTKRITPTRSHPEAPNRPYAENLAVLMTGPVDQFLDLMRSWPDEGEI